MSSPEQQIQTLSEKLHYLNHRYYQDSVSEISDMEFDALLRELQDLEKQHPTLAQPDSPTQRVGGAITKEFRQIRHQYPMLSLGNTYSREELLEFDERVRKGLNGEPFEYVCELKIDGVAISLIYENGVLTQAITRGDGRLFFFADLKAVPRRECAALLEKVGLADAAGRRVREYSKGMRQRLGFAQALLGKPRILFLDEPTTGLDPEAIRGFYAILRQLKSEGVTMVITSHILAEIQERVDRLAIMAAGKVQATGTVQALREQMDLPLWFDVRVAPEDFEAVRNALGGLPVGAIEARDGHVAVQCARDAKMAVIAALATLNGKVRDLTVREPSLEDVFFGFSD